MLKRYFADAVNDAVAKAIKNGDLPKCENITELRTETPKNKDFGDFAVNVSPLAKTFRLAPPVIAEKISSHLKKEDFEVNIVGGFMNFKVGKNFLTAILNEILLKKIAYGSSNIGKKEKVLLEYVSANPTGPFHIGHGRWAAVGSALADILMFTGFDVTSEFYVNDAGNQVKNLGNSLFIRVKQQQGINIDFPSDETEAKKFYTGEYLIDCAKKFCKLHPDDAKRLSKAENLSSEDLKLLSDFAKFDMLDKQKQLLEKFQTRFDNFYLETTLHQNNDVQKCLDELQNKNMLYEKDGALWFKSSQFGDDEDRVIRKADGALTYLAADIAYHYDKIKRGFSKLINIWGADHHGYIARIKASIEALGNNPDCLTVLLGQLVNLCIKGDRVRMGKRTKMITLDDLIEEVGVDATRYWMVMRSIDTTLEFDVELAKSQTEDNPVFYIQYAHARACSVLRTATSERPDTVNNVMKPAVFDNIDFDKNPVKDFSILYENEEEFPSIKTMVLKLEEYKSVIEQASLNYAPYLVAKYLRELAAVFHKFYASCRILSDDKDLSYVKLSLVQSTVFVLRSGLMLLGVSAPREM